ncbi:MAG: F0F1 ATP synthase subunit alpha [Candidatus Levybacteria bacterium]|nr:F0F1 ATP synthase subunit alpha [Candidatus Levybacteria bacterium]
MNSQFNALLEKSGEYGVVYQVSHPIVFIEGLPKVRTHEVIIFETGQKAEVFAINRGKVEARTFSHEPIRVGTMVTRTGDLLSVPVGQELLGHTINPLGEPLDPSIPFTAPKVMRDLDAKPAGISGRQKITKHLITGVSLLDLMIPLGIGQRELIIGDRKTGKTSLLMTTIKSQIYEGNTVIYAAIAKKKSEIKKLQQFFEQEKIMSKIVIVATSSYDSPTLIFQTPYAAMSIAEYFRDLGTNTILILDDLSTHAKFYREISLLARRFPGRDSYPGDIFFVHSKLLERAGNFKHKTAGEVSITCLPVIEIVEGDFTGYISTNVMGITDGHIYLDANIYYQGMRPAVNVPLSVTRVGRQTLDKLSRDINKELTAFLSEYNKVLAVSHFGQELTEDVKRSLRLGEMVNKFFSQPYQETVPHKVQLIIISLILQDQIKTKEDLEKIKKGLIAAYYDRGKQKLLYDVTTAKDFKSFNTEVLTNKDALIAFAG